MGFYFVLPYCRLVTEIMVFLKYHDVKFNFYVRILFKILQAKFLALAHFCTNLAKLACESNLTYQLCERINIKYAKNRVIKFARLAFCLDIGC